MTRETTLARRPGARPTAAKRRQSGENGHRGGAERQVSLDDKYVLEEGRILSLIHI